MSLDEKFISIRTVWYQIVESFFKKTAGLLGYPKNPGMPAVYTLPDELYNRAEFLDKLPVHASNWGRQPQPTTWFEMIFGASPKVDTVLKIPFESEKDGFVSFYIQNYKNIYFLPDWLSEFLQVRLNLCSDLTLLETIREVLFVGLVIYSQIVILRIALSWFIYINPYTFPWCYVAAAVDWTEDVLQGLVPSVLGVNITGTVFLGILGVMADSLNHLVFTMPYLPSEGIETKALLNQYQGQTDVIMFRGFPTLWQRYPIPNEIREFWYHERKDIFDYYMQEYYKNQGIQVLPDSVIQQLNQQKLKADLTQIYDAVIDKKHYFSDIASTQVLANNDLIQGHEFIPHLNSINQHFYDFWITQLDKLY
jgi:uncharacterized protein YggT (Ycf19 family)